MNAAEVKTKLATEFANIKASISSITNLGSYADDLYTASELRRMAEARYKGAVSAAQSVGVLPTEGDATDDPGNYSVYNDGVIHIDMSVKSPASRLDKTALRVELIKAGVSATIIDAAMSKATKQNKPARSFVVSIID